MGSESATDSARDCVSAPRSAGVPRCGRALRQLLVAGDDIAWRELDSQVRPLMLAKATRVLGDADLAGDVVSGAFLQLWQRRSERFPDNPVAWLLRSTWLRALDERRSRATRAAREEAWARTASPSQRSPLDEAARRELGARIDDAIGTLPPRRKQAFELVVVDGEGTRNAGCTMAAAEKSVENYVAAARVQLQALLREYAVEWLAPGAPRSTPSDLAGSG